MKGKITVIAIASFIIYIFLATTLFFSIPFMVTWGSEKSWYMKLIIFAQSFPLSLTDKAGEIHLGFILINAFFWTLFFAAILYVVALITNKKIN